MTQAITPTRKRLTIITPTEPDSDNVKGPVTKLGFEDVHKTFKYMMKPLFNDYVLDSGPSRISVLSGEFPLAYGRW